MAAKALIDSYLALPLVGEDPRNIERLWRRLWMECHAAGPAGITTLALSFDHRHIDGEKGSRFLADVAGILEDPASALLF